MGFAFFMGFACFFFGFTLGAKNAACASRVRYLAAVTADVTGLGLVVLVVLIAETGVSGLRRVLRRVRGVWAGDAGAELYKRM